MPSPVMGVPLNDLVFDDVDDFDDRLAEYAAIGQRNQELINLAGHHCLNLRFEPTGPAGMMENLLDLPLNMRHAVCPVAVGERHGMQLEDLAIDFYRGHCVGCDARRPTGQVPNLKTLVDQRDSEAEEAARMERGRHQKHVAAWRKRDETRRALLIDTTPAMVNAIRDIGIIDMEPEAPPATAPSALPPTLENPGQADPVATAARAQADDARQRLVALADRAPQTFTNDVINASIGLIEHEGRLELLEPLRHLAAHRTELRDRLVVTSLDVLREARAVEAGRCLSDFATELAALLTPPSESPTPATTKTNPPTDELAPLRLDPASIASLIFIAGAPSDHLGRSFQPVLQSRDPTGLRAVASIRPGDVAEQLRRMLPRPATSSIVLPPATSRRPGTNRPEDLERYATAGAIRALATTHAQLVEGVLEDLLLSLVVSPEDSHDTGVAGEAQRAAATMIVLGSEHAWETVERLGAGGAKRMRSSLMKVYWQVANLLDNDGRFRDADDAQPAIEITPTLLERLMSTMLLRVSGDWGDDPRFDAAEIIERRASHDPAATAIHLTAILGSILDLTDALEASAPPTTLTRTDQPRLSIPAPDPETGWMDEFTRENTLSQSRGRLLRAVEAIAATAPAETCARINDLVVNERETARGPKVISRLLATLGEIGAKHGGEPGVLTQILPTLYTYLLDTESEQQHLALDAWSKIGARHRLPSTLEDLLPALLTDPQLSIPLLTAAYDLPWTPESTTRLAEHALRMLAAIDPGDDTFFEYFVKAFTTLRRLTTDEDARERIEKRTLQRVADAYVNNGTQHPGMSHKLRRFVDLKWTRPAQTSLSMTRLRLLLAPESTNRFRTDDRAEEALNGLLDCAEGLTEVPRAVFAAVTNLHLPRHVHATFEYLEILWRAGRIDDVAEIANATGTQLPEGPAFDSERNLLGVLSAEATLETVLNASPGPSRNLPTDPPHTHANHAEILAAFNTTCSALATASTHDDMTAQSICTQIAIRLVTRQLLLDLPPNQSLQQTMAHLERAGSDAHAKALSPLRPPTDADAFDEVTSALLSRATALTHTADALMSTTDEDTVTGAYIRHFSALCRIGSHRLRADAASLNADVTVQTAHTAAATKRRESLQTDLGQDFAGTDPLGGPLQEALVDANDKTTADLLREWAQLPLPVTTIQNSQDDVGAFPTTETNPRTPPVAVALVSINSQLVTGPAVLRPGTVHDLTLEVHTDPWPDWADRLEAELVSVIRKDEFERPTFAFPRTAASSAAGIYTGSGSVLVHFKVPPGQPAPPLMVKLTWRGTENNEPRMEALNVAGHRELRLRPHDPVRDSRTDNVMVDERLLGMYDQLTQSDHDPDQLQAFSRLLTAICRAGLRLTFVDAKYRGRNRVRELEFHNDLHHMLMADPELGGRVERGARTGHGFLDVRHDGITAELKVEPRTPVTRSSATKYIGQPTQYAGADGARLSILVILDMSPKGLPVATQENYLFLLGPRHHGLENPEAPSVVATLVINGNLPVPSSWSRRKLPTNDDPATVY